MVGIPLYELFRSAGCFRGVCNAAVAETADCVDDSLIEAEEVDVFIHGAWHTAGLKSSNCDITPLIWGNQ